MKTTQYSLTFLAGALVPAVSIYLTGGSNRFNLIFGLTLGICIILLPVLLWPSRVLNVILAFEQFRLTLAGKPGREPRTTAHSKNLEESIQKDVPVPEAAPGHPYAGDVVSALINLGGAVGKSQKLVNQLVQQKEYPTFEELFHDALAVSGKRAAR
jgi:hypothetical protein